MARRNRPRAARRVTGYALNCTTVDRVIAVAAERGISRSALVDEALTAYLAAQDTAA